MGADGDGADDGDGDSDSDADDDAGVGGGVDCCREWPGEGDERTVGVARAVGAVPVTEPPGTLEAETPSAVRGMPVRVAVHPARTVSAASVTVARSAARRRPAIDFVTAAP